MIKRKRIQRNLKLSVTDIERLNTLKETVNSNNCNNVCKKQYK